MIMFVMGFRGWLLNTTILTPVDQVARRSLTRKSIERIERQNAQRKAADAARAA